MEEPSSQVARPPRSSKLDPYKKKIDELIDRYPRLSAVRVLEEISKGEDGYQGRITLVKDYLRTIRPTPGRVYHEVLYENRAKLSRSIGAVVVAYKSVTHREKFRCSSPCSAIAGCVTSSLPSALFPAKAIDLSGQTSAASTHLPRLKFAAPIWLVLFDTNGCEGLVRRMNKGRDTMAALVGMKDVRLACQKWP